MKFWEEVAEAGGVLKEFQHLIEVKNSITAPACKVCTHTCCTSDQVGLMSGRSKINDRLVALRTEIRTIKPLDSSFCTWLYDKTCLIEDIKPPVCIRYWCGRCIDNIKKYNRLKKNTPIHLEEIMEGLNKGLRSLAESTIPRKTKNDYVDPYNYYFIKLDQYLTQSSTINDLIIQWRNIKYRLPPEQWYDHFAQVATYYYSLAHMWHEAQREERQSEYLQRYQNAGES